MGPDAGPLPGAPAPGPSPQPATAGPAPGGAAPEGTPQPAATKGPKLDIRPLSPKTARPAKPPAVADALSGAGSGDQAPQPSAAFKFAGRDFKDLAEAEKYFGEYHKSAAGRQRASEERIAFLTQQVEQVNELARGWYAAHERLKGKGGQPATPAQPETPFVDSLDWEFAENLAQEQGVGAALYWLTEQLKGHFDQRLKEAIGEAVTPINTRDSQSQLFDSVMQEFSTMASEQRESGEPAFPELTEADPEAAAAVVEIWTSLPREFALNPQSRRQAIEYAVYKYRSSVGAAPGRAAPSAQPSPAAAVARAAEAGGVAGDPLTGVGHPAPRSGDAPPDPQADLRRGLAKSRGLYVTLRGGHSLGFKRLAPPEAAEG